jgi:hypothetical protein
MTSTYRKQRPMAPKGLVWCPETAFCGAMLMQALLDGLLHNRRNFRAEARLWMLAASEQPGGFAWCCRGVLLDPDTVCQAILARWRQGIPQGKNHRIPHCMRMVADGAGESLPPSLIGGE